jgi:hypothetical protein
MMIVATRPSSARFVLAILFVAIPGWTQFSQQGPKLVGTGVEPFTHAEQGRSVAISGDGKTVIVGGIRDGFDLGAAWIWTKAGGAWLQQGNKLTASGTAGRVFQGWSVSLSADGNTAIMGGPSYSSGAGAAWVWIRNGEAWMQQGGKLQGSGAIGNANQGNSVSLSADGNTAIVGGPNDNGQAGAAWIWTRSGGVWTQQGNKLVASGATGNAFQGVAVSLSADGNTALVGGRYDDGNAGAAWIWTRNNGVWTQQGDKIIGSGAVGKAQQGASVALSGDGDTAIVGGPDDNLAGAAWIWTKTAGVWTQQGPKLFGFDAVGNAGQGGFGVSLSGDGNTAIVGAWADNGGVGAAWVWTRTEARWTQQGNKLVGADVAGNAFQGFSVSLSGDGKTAIIGGYEDDRSTGAAWVFTAATDHRDTSRRRAVRH